MRLRDAILRAAKFAAKDDNNQRALNTVRLVPPPEPTEPGGWPDRPGYVMATDGSTGIVIYVDPMDTYPDLAVDAKAIVAALKGVEKGGHFTLQRRTEHSAGLDTAGGKHIVATRDHKHYPAMPAAPERLHKFDRYDLIKAVQHAVGKDKDASELKGIHFHPKWTEATDQSRIARSSVALAVGQSHLVPATLFRNWPSRKTHPLGTAVGFANGNAFFWVDEELRFGGCLDAKAYFDLSPMFPPEHQGTRVCLDRADMKQSVKLALDSTEKQWVELRFGEGKLSVSGLSELGNTQYVQVFDAPEATALVNVVVRGKLLWEALHNIPDREVVVCYSTPSEPLRIECDNFVEALWPLVLAEG